MRASPSVSSLVLETESLPFSYFRPAPQNRVFLFFPLQEAAARLVFDWPDTFTFTSAGQDLQLGRWADCLYDQDLRVLVWRGFEVFAGGVNHGCRWCELAELIEQVTCENTFSAAFLTGSCWSTQWWVTDCQRCSRDSSGWCWGGRVLLCFMQMSSHVTWLLPIGCLVCFIDSNTVVC